MISIIWPIKLCFEIIHLHIDYCLKRTCGYVTFSGGISIYDFPPILSIKNYNYLYLVLIYTYIKYMYILYTCVEGSFCQWCFREFIKTMRASLRHITFVSGVHCSHNFSFCILIFIFIFLFLSFLPLFSTILFR